MITYRDTLAAHTTLRVYHEVRGVKRGRKCVAPPGPKQRSNGKPCTRLMLVGSFKHHDNVGTNRLRHRPDRRARAKPGQLRAQGDRQPQRPAKPHDQLIVHDPGTASDLPRPRPRRRLRRTGTDLTGPPLTQLAPRFEQTGDRGRVFELRMPLPSATFCSGPNRTSR